MSADDVDLPTANALARYEWDCPECGKTNDVPFGAEYGIEQCDSCGASVQVVEG